MALAYIKSWLVDLDDILTTERRKSKECPGIPGDLIQFRRGSYSHWAVNVGNNEIVHLTGDGWGSVVSSAILGSLAPGVQKESYEQVNQDAKSGKTKIRSGSIVTASNEEHGALPGALPQQVIVERALSQVGQNGYHLFVNNCEHYATWCRYTKGFSKQSLRLYKPKPNGGTRNQEDGRLDYLLKAERHSWFVVMTDERWTHLICGAAASDQERWEKTTEFPMAELDEKWSEGKIISLISTATDAWLTTWRPAPADGPSPTDSDVQGAKRFDNGCPKATVKSLVEWANKQRMSGRIITKLGSHGGTIVAVSERRKVSELGRIYYYKENFTKLHTHIEEAWEDGRGVLTVIYFNGWWIVQTSTRVKGEQKCIVSNEVPRSEIERHWSEGYLIQTAAAGAEWVIIMLKTSTLPEQSFRCYDTFSEVQEYMRMKSNENMVITAVTGN